jgi:N6-L-threonylcarbamoyladenine synthase
MGVLGFDTSNYTTSAAWTDGKKNINIRQLLSVKEGERGLRQSDGVFQHMKIMPELFESLADSVDISDVTAVGVSTRPRTVEGSYMPVFLAGEGYARCVSKTLGVPLYRFSHQDGHVMAGIYSCSAFELLEGDFISVHLSGGTTEILKSRYEGHNFVHNIIGGTKDISAGQFIDRVGVRMGMKFPAGKTLEQLAFDADKSEKLPISADGAYVSFSGVETKAARMAGECSNANLALGVLENVRDTLARAINSAVSETGIHRILIAGGVAANSIIRDGFMKMLDGDVYLAEKEYSSDNAVGIAYLAYLSDKEA